MKCLHNAHETAYYFQLALVVRLFYGSFACVLPPLEYHFNSLLLSFIIGVCSEIPCSFVLLFWGNQLFEFYRRSTDRLSHDAGSGCGESWNRLLAVLYLFFFFVYLCFAFVWLLQGYFLRTCLVNYLDDIY